MDTAVDALGLVANLFAVADALGFNASAQAEQNERLLFALQQMQISTENIQQIMSDAKRIIQNTKVLSSVIEVRSRLPVLEAIPDEKIELLLKLLFAIKNCPCNLVFAVIVKYQVCENTATNGFSGTSSDAIEFLVRKLDDFVRPVNVVESELTYYVTVRIRGKYDHEIENAGIAALTSIATEICGSSRELHVKSVLECPLSFCGEKTIVLLKPFETNDLRCEYDHLRRVFVIGETGSGKSTIGNALLNKDKFRTSEGMTGTMHIERAERADQVSNELWITEVYDTLGFNDKDDLDTLYQAAIENCIRTVQRASTLLMTINVKPRMTNSASLSLGTYRELFGNSIASMLLVVVTVNESADLRTLRYRIDLNWPTISRWDKRICKENIFCVSLYDLRVLKQSDSHDIVDYIASKCRNMPPQLIQSLADRYSEVRQALVDKLSNAQQQLQSLVDDGWQAYDQLTNQFEQSPYVKLVDEEYSLLDGFVMKNTDADKLLLSFVTFGLCNTIRKVNIHLVTNSDVAADVWLSFLNAHKHERHRSDLMSLFGDLLYDHELAVLVSDMDVYYKGTLRVKPYKVFIFKPVAFSFDDVSSFLNDIRTKSGEHFRDDVVAHLFKSIVPVAQRCAKMVQKGKGRAIKH